MPKIALFYHCVFDIGGKRLPSSVPIIQAQVRDLRNSGLLLVADEVYMGINGGRESYEIADAVLPPEAYKEFHGIDCRNECRTFLMMERFIRNREGDWVVFYGHSKGATKPIGDIMATQWRNCMMGNLVLNWRQCVNDLGVFESVGCHWATPPKTPPTQYIWAGTFFWARLSFLKTLPSILERDRLKVSGIDSVDSRWEPEVWVGNGSRRPSIKDYCPGWMPGKPHLGLS